jgi:hypothetical protein
MAGPWSRFATKGECSDYRSRAFLAYKANRTIQLTKDGKNIKRAAQTAVLLRIHDKQHRIPAIKAMTRSNFPFSMARPYHPIPPNRIAVATSLFHSSGSE